MSLIDTLVSLYAPHSCVGCAMDGAVLCVQCAADLPEPPACCYRCQLPMVTGRTCPACSPDASLSLVKVYTGYTGTAKQAVAALKFNRARQAGQDIGRVMAERYGHLLAEGVLIVPVPTARTRVRKRGYDQASVIARAFAGAAQCRYAPVLARLGAQEQKTAGRRQRQSQLAGAFSVMRPQQVRGARIILIDDVMTTGSTLDEVACVLREAGASKVGALVFARA